MAEDIPEPHLSESVREITIKTRELKDALIELAKSPRAENYQIWLSAVGRDFRTVSRRLDKLSQHIELERQLGGKNG